MYLKVEAEFSRHLLYVSIRCCSDEFIHLLRKIIQFFFLFHLLYWCSFLQVTEHIHLFEELLKKEMRDWEIKHKVNYPPKNEPKRKEVKKIAKLFFALNMWQMWNFPPLSFLQGTPYSMYNCNTVSTVKSRSYEPPCCSKSWYYKSLDLTIYCTFVTSTE